MNNFTTKEELIKLLDGYDNDRVYAYYMTEDEAKNYFFGGVDFSDIHEINSVDYYTESAYICKIYYEDYLNSNQDISFQEFLEKYNNPNWHFVEDEINEQYESDLCNEYEWCSCEEMTDYNNERKTCPYIMLEHMKKALLKNLACSSPVYDRMIYQSDFI